ncbi:MAG: cyclic nucleotide-binding domain-containing protein [Zetaproteobacteria bacterium]|nr:MAG: cyclic nucleotide-binding domain-containing protein [Zetaproteobacteria bacterium]
MDGADRILTGERFPLLATLDDAELAGFRRAARRIAVCAGERLLEEEKRNDDLHLVASGRMVAQRTHRGRQIPIGFIGPGDIFGEQSLLQDRRTTASIHAESAGEVWRVPGRLVRRQYDGNGRFRRAVDLVMERRMVHTALALNSLFSVLPAEVRQSMYHTGTMVRFPAGAELQRQHDRDIRRSYLLLEGEAVGSITLSDPPGRVVEVARFGPGDQVGEIAVLDVPERIMTVTAHTPLTTFCISNETLHTFRMGNIDFALALYENSRRLLQRQCDLLAGTTGIDRARRMTVDRLVPFDRYCDPHQRKAHPLL